MKTNYILFVIFIMGALTLNSYAQEIKFEKEDFRLKENYKEAKDLVQKGDEYYALGYGGYRSAIDFYLKAYQLNSRNAALNYKIGNCFLFTTNKVKCIDYFLSAYDLNSSIMDDIAFKLAWGYHLNLDFDNAVKYYTKFKNSLSPNDTERKEMIEKRLEECKTGAEMVKNPVRVFIDNLGPNVNSVYADYSPLISTDESMLIYTAKRGEDKDPRAESGYFYENIFISYSDDYGKNWTVAQNIGAPLNKKDENNATVGLSPDGQQLFVFNQENGGDILISELEGSEWSKPDDKVTKKYINSEFHETSASFSFDGRTMYFVSNQMASAEDLRKYDNPNEIPHDLLYTKWDEKKQRWGEPQNLSNTINTKYDERGVFMHPDGRTIYFSSKGHKTMGGLDIFKSELQDDGTWSEPENLGYPINTPDDDVFFVMAASGKHGYFASARIDDKQVGDYDIYRITFRGPEKPVIQSNEDNLLASTEPISEVVMEASVEIKTMRLTILKGTIKDAIDLTPLEAEIEIVDNEKNEVISVMKSNSSTGKYLVSLPSGKNYGIAVKATDYLFHSENFIIPEATNYQEITKDILLNKMAVGSKIILKNIFFDYAKATLRPESNAELDRLVDLLNKYPATRIEISGHTDNRGSLKLNQTLSESRAKSVVEYLIEKGIPEARLEYKGYAYFQPVATNDTEEGRQENRRVEFKVLSDK